MDNQGGAVGRTSTAWVIAAWTVAEDVLGPEPNCLIPAFRYSIVSLKDGEVVTGLAAAGGRAGAGLCGCDRQRRFPFPKKTSESRSNRKSSLMPDNFSELIPAEDLNNLMAFLSPRGPSPRSSLTENKKAGAKCSGLGKIWRQLYSRASYTGTTIGKACVLDGRFGWIGSAAAL